MKNEFKTEGDSVIMAVQGRQVIFDIDDMPIVGQYRWKSSRKSSVNTGYRDEKGIGRTLTLHKLLTGSKYVNWLNGNVYDYRRANIRPSDKAIQHHERGVYLKGNEYRIEKDTVVVLIKSKGKTYEAYIDYEDYPIISEYTWCRNVVTGYAQTIDRISRKGIYMHRLILDASGFYIKTDHINGDKLDNRKCNLRCCDDSQNHHNTYRHRECLTGVSRHSDGGWTARLQVKNIVHRKYFKSFDEAVEQYRKWEQEFNPSGLNKD